MKALALGLVVLAACSDSPPAQVDPMPDAAQQTPDAPPVAAGDCNNGEHIVMTGAMALDVASGATATFGGHIIGVTGAVTPTELYALALRKPTQGNWDTVGDIDVASLNMKFLEMQQGSDCATAGSCSGFFALAGTLHVLETSPRFRATFELTDLHHHDDYSDTMGVPIAGSVTGCVNANPI